MDNDLLLDRVKYLRKTLYKKPITQLEIDSFVNELSPYKNRLMPNDKTEPFLLIDEQGDSLGVEAPRWICHLLGLKHKAVHLLLFSKNDANGMFFILQVRAFQKFEYPGYLDISVGGHVIGKETADATVAKEMEEELGIQIDVLSSKKIFHISRSLSDLLFIEEFQKPSGYFLFGYYTLISYLSRYTLIST